MLHGRMADVAINPKEGKVPQVMINTAKSAHGTFAVDTFPYTRQV